MNLLGTTLFVGVLALLFWANYESYYIMYTVFSIQLENKEQVLTPFGNFVMILIQSIFTLAITSYFRSSFADPGFLIPLEVPQKGYYPENLIKSCKSCIATIEGKTFNIFKPPRAHHCKTCKKCVFRMDHHCEWINNCVGYKNQKYFILFLVYTLIYSTLIFGILIYQFIFVYLRTKNKMYLFLMMGWNTVGLTFLGVFALFFLFMCISFLRDQIDAIKESQTTVESYKYQQGKPQTLTEGIKQVFGDNWKLWWLPVEPNTFHINYLELLYSDQELTYMAENKINSFLEDGFGNDFFDKYWIKKSEKQLKDLKDNKTKYQQEILKNDEQLEKLIKQEQNSKKNK